MPCLTNPHCKPAFLHNVACLQVWLEGMLLCRDGMAGSQPRSSQRTGVYAQMSDDDSEELDEDTEALLASLSSQGESSMMQSAPQPGLLHALVWCSLPCSSHAGCVQERCTDMCFKAEGRPELSWSWQFSLLTPAQQARFLVEPLKSLSSWLCRCKAGRYINTALTALHCTGPQHIKGCKQSGPRLPC